MSKMMVVVLHLLLLVMSHRSHLRDIGATTPLAVSKTSWAAAAACGRFAKGFLAAVTAAAVAACSVAQCRFWLPGARAAASITVWQAWVPHTMTKTTMYMYLPVSPMSVLERTLLK